MTAALAVAVSCSDTGPGGERYFAVLNGAGAVPQNPSSSSGTVTLNVEQSGAGVDFSIFVQNITGVTAARLASGQPGAVGTVILDLYSNPGGSPGISSGILASGRITDNDLAGMSLDSLVTVLRNLSAYVSIHTQGVPGGEIRGQLYRN